MLNFKGIYEWKLINKDTGAVEKEDTVHNIITDAFLALLNASHNTSYGMRIQLSNYDVGTDSEIDFRGGGVPFNIIAQTTEVIGTRANMYDTGTNSMSIDHNFPPPTGSPREIKIMGSRFASGYFRFGTLNSAVRTGNFASFVILSEPITQNTNQYLYIRYTITLEFNGGIYTHPHFINWLRGDILDRARRFRYTNQLRLTPFRDPIRKENVCYTTIHRYHDDVLRMRAVSDDSVTHGTRYQHNFGVSDIPGPVGSVHFSINSYIYGTSNIGTVPSISRVFLHAENRISSTFSEPAHPPLSQGVVSTIGPTTTSQPMYVKVKITKTGEANNTPDTETGKYKLELLPWAQRITIAQTRLPIDFQGKLIHGDAIHSLKYGDYLYSVYHSSASNRFNIGKWYWWSVESAEALCEFSDGITEVRTGVNVGSVMYLATDDGVYKYDSSNESTPPEKLVLTGLINDDIKDITYDPIREILWTGHTTGLCKINLDAGTAEQYLNTEGGHLYGLTDPRVNINVGMLQAYDGKVIKAGGNFTRHPYGVTGNWDHVWYFDDDLKKHVIIISGDINLRGATFRRKDGSTNQVFVSRFSANNRYNYRLYEVQENVGELESVLKLNVTPNVDIGFFSDRLPTSHPIQQGKNKFHQIVRDSSSNCRTVCLELREDGLGEYSIYTEGHSGNISLDFSTTIPDYANPFEPNKNLIWSDGVPSYIHLRNLVRFSYPSSTNTRGLIEYGWDGTKWVLDHDGERDITEETHELLNGISIDFNNAPGYNWDNQFRVGERFTFMISPTLIKDNLQTFRLDSRFYYCDARHVRHYEATIPLADPHEIIIPEASDPDFRDMDTLDFTIVVFNKNNPAEVLEQTTGTPDEAGQYVATTDGKFVFNAVDAGKIIDMSYTYTLY